ncbi:hypothetical protein JCM8097_004139 [Rhodosporidiobolus ruineniae]
MDDATTHGMQACWVCGKETRNRCGGCGKAGIDIFFCSPEHQRFVWPIHKLFCGPGKANPFLLPPLSPDEAAEAKAHASDEYHDADMLIDPVDPLSLEKLLTRSGTIAKDKIGDLLDTFVSGNVPAVCDGRVNQLQLALIRLAEFYRLQQQQTTRPKTMAKSPVHYALAQVCKMIVRDVGELYSGYNVPITDVPWLPHLLHRATFHFFVLAKGWEMPSKRNEAAEHYTCKRLEGVMKDEVEPDRPKVAELLFASLKWGTVERAMFGMMGGVTFG